MLFQKQERREAVWDPVRTQMEEWLKFGFVCSRLKGIVQVAVFSLSPVILSI